MLPLSCVETPKKFLTRIAKPSRSPRHSKPSTLLRQGPNHRWPKDFCCSILDFNPAVAQELKGSTAKTAGFWVAVCFVESSLRVCIQFCWAAAKGFLMQIEQGALRVCQMVRVTARSVCFCSWVMMAPNPLECVAIHANI